MHDNLHPVCVVLYQPFDDIEGVLSINLCVYRKDVLRFYTGRQSLVSLQGFLRFCRTLSDSRSPPNNALPANEKVGGALVGTG